MESYSDSGAWLRWVAKTVVFSVPPIMATMRQSGLSFPPYQEAVHLSARQNSVIRISSEEKSTRVLASGNWNQEGDFRIRPRLERQACHLRYNPDKPSSSALSEPSLEGCKPCFDCRTNGSISRQNLRFSTCSSLFFRLRIDCSGGNPAISGVRFASAAFLSTTTIEG